MQNRILLVVVICLSIILAVVSSRNTTFFDNQNMITVKDSLTEEIKELELEEYIVGVVAGEMPASFNEEALKAQAVAARTYAAFKITTSTNEYAVVTDVTDQHYITTKEMKELWGNDYDKYYGKIKKAVNETKNQIMFYEDKIVEAYYFAMSNGYTENCEEVFSQKRDYLQSVASVYDNDSINNFSVTKVLTKQEFLNKLSITSNDILINNIERSKTNRVLEITINNKTFLGTEVRNLLGLRSTDFTISIKDDEVQITTKGYGHGVGMSQYGANGMANVGFNYEEILKYYYQNIEIKTI